MLDKRAKQALLCSTECNKSKRRYSATISDSNRSIERIQWLYGVPMCVFTRCSTRYRPLNERDHITEEVFDNSARLVVIWWRELRRRRHRCHCRHFMKLNWIERELSLTKSVVHRRMTLMNDLPPLISSGLIVHLFMSDARLASWWQVVQFSSYTRWYRYTHGCKCNHRLGHTHTHNRTCARDRFWQWELVRNRRWE